VVRLRKPLCRKTVLSMRSFALRTVQTLCLQAGRSERLQEVCTSRCIATAAAQPAQQGGALGILGVVLGLSAPFILAHADSPASARGWEAPSQLQTRLLAPSRESSTARETPSDISLKQLLAADPSSLTAVLLALPAAVLLGQAAPLGPSGLHAIATALPPVSDPSSSSSSVGSKGPAVDRTGTWGSMADWEVCCLARGLALLLGPQLEGLRPDVVSTLHTRLDVMCASRNASLHDITSLAWSCAVLGGGLSSHHLAAVKAGVTSQGGRPASWDEPSTLLLLDALLLSAAHLQGASPATALAPRVSRAALEDLVSAWPRAARTRLLSAYDEYVPLADYMSGALLVVLHTALCLPPLPPASASPTTPASVSAPGPDPPSFLASWSAGGQPTSPQRQPWGAAALSQLASGASPQALQGAAVLLGLADDPGARNGGAGSGSSSRREVARLRRDLQVHWRQDELVDARQRAANDVAHLVAHGVGVALQRPLDADLVLPSRRSIVRVEDDTDASAVAALSSQSAQGFTLGVGAATLRWLGSERFAPATKYHRCVCPGLWLARDRFDTRKPICPPYADFHMHEEALRAGHGMQPIEERLLARRQEAELQLQELKLQAEIKLQAKRLKAELKLAAEKQDIELKLALKKQAAELKLVAEKQEAELKLAKLQQKATLSALARQH
ncbi:hypothetical protein QJQ45_029104, partial [Haematococcus lacustris]